MFVSLCFLGCVVFWFVVVFVFCRRVFFFNGRVLFVLVEEQGPALLLRLLLLLWLLWFIFLVFLFFCTVVVL